MKNKILSAQSIVNKLIQCTISHIVWLPDTGARLMYKAFENQNDISLIPVCREGEAIAIAAGLRIGGQNSAVWLQNTGLFESGDSIRGIGLKLELPLLLIVGYRGWLNNKPITDSAAIYTIPILKAWGINHYLIETNDDLDKINVAYEETYAINKPVAILIGREYLKS